MDPSVLQLIHAAIAEDVGPGDVTCQYFVSESLESQAKIVARESGVMAGGDIAETVFREVGGSTVTMRLADGDAFSPGDVLLEAKGKTRALLTAERTALNFLQRLCGVATMARTYVEAVKPHPVEVWDTRKTTPGWRLIEKAAVKSGGAVNHRMGLYDHVMVKDNHLAADDSLERLQDGIDLVRKERPGVRIQIEAATLQQVADFLSLRNVDMLLLDNMTIAQLRHAVEIVDGRVWLEASGGITLKTIKDVAATGVNAISVGALTHSARALDLGLDLF
jgi:nicotinate-nucleotide pyrophosphorylase (carboxylating)